MGKVSFQGKQEFIFEAEMPIQVIELTAARIKENDKFEACIQGISIKIRKGTEYVCDREGGSWKVLSLVNIDERTRYSEWLN